MSAPGQIPNPSHRRAPGQACSEEAGQPGSPLAQRRPAPAAGERLPRAGSGMPEPGGGCSASAERRRHPPPTPAREGEAARASSETRRGPGRRGRRLFWFCGTFWGFVVCFVLFWGAFLGLGGFFGFGGWGFVLGLVCGLVLFGLFWFWFVLFFGVFFVNKLFVSLNEDFDLFLILDFLTYFFIVSMVEMNGML